MAARYNTLKIDMRKNQLSLLLDTINEFNKISNIHKIKFLNDKLLLYTILCDENNKKRVNVMKCLIINKTDMFNDIPDNFVSEYIIPDSKTFYNKFKFLLDDNKETVKIELAYTDECIGSFKGINDFLSVSALTSDNSSILDLSLDTIKSKMNINNANCSFTVLVEHIKRILKLSTLDKANSLIDVAIENNQAVFSEREWSLIVDKNVISERVNLRFNKNYLKLIQTNNESVIFYLFDSFILIKEDNNYLLLNIELT